MVSIHDYLDLVNLSGWIVFTFLVSSKIKPRRVEGHFLLLTRTVGKMIEIIFKYIKE